MDRIIFHVDVNNAFLSWTAVERLKNGFKVDLREIPSVIGGDESMRHGVVLAKSPVAKKYGIVTAETLYQARKKCPKLVVIQSDHSIYKKYSDQLYNYLCNFTPDIERFSIDECFLDMTGTYKIFGDPLLLAQRMSKEIYANFGFTVNIGIANNKLCAKMASDFEKPNKVHTLFMNEIPSKMWVLPVDDLFMVGRKSAAVLKKMGINTIYDLAHADSNLLFKHFKSRAILMKNYANGIDDSLVYEEDKQEGISNSETFPSDIEDLSILDEKIQDLCEMVGFRLRKLNYYCHTVVLILKSSSFKVYSHQKTLNDSINTTHDIYNVAKGLLRIMWNGEPIRLIGIRVTNFSNSSCKQLSLFDEENEDFSKVQSVVDELKNKYGKDILINANKIKKDTL